MRTNCLVAAILFDGDRAIGVRCKENGVETEFKAGREVILSASTLQSPQLLQLAGIGPADHLRGLGIEVRHHSPSVGQNLREHWLAMLQFRLSRPLSQNPAMSGARAIFNGLRYMLTHGGILASSPHDVIGFLKSRPGLDRPDAHFVGGPWSRDRSAPPGVFRVEQEHGFHFGVHQLRPESQGSVMIATADPAASPTITTNYLATENDRRVAIDSFRMMRRMFDQSPIRELISAESFPGAAVQSDDEIAESIVRTGNPLYHAAGTCRMGSDTGSVVDSRLRVRGVRALRVIDLSVFPTLVSGATAAPVMAIAWRGGDMVLEDAAAEAPTSRQFRLYRIGIRT